MVALLATLLHEWSGNTHTQKKAHAHSVAPWQHMKYLFCFCSAWLNPSLLGCLVFPLLNTIDRAPSILDAHPTALLTGRLICNGSSCWFIASLFHPPWLCLNNRCCHFTGGLLFPIGLVIRLPVIGELCAENMIFSVAAAKQKPLHKPECSLQRSLV